MAKQHKRSVPAIPRTGTVAAREYYSTASSIGRFFNWLMHLAGFADHVRKTAASALAGVADSEEEKRQYEESLKKPGVIDELKRHRQLLLEVVLVRHVEAFLNYLANLMFEIFTQRPETLRSADKVEVSRILQHATIKEVVHELARRKVDGLAYSSFSDLVAFFDERFGLYVVTAEELDTVREAIETRNISVHNRCIINERFIARTGAAAERLGTVRELYIDEVEKLVHTLGKSVRTLDQRARRKLKIRGTRFGRDKT